MRVAVLSDIHANLPAFEAVLEDIEDVGVDEVWCLGDVVGYGASPDECVDLTREHCDVSLVGNHDLAVLAQLDTSTFSSAARTAVEWTVERCSDASLDFLRSLTPADTSRRRCTTPPPAIRSGNTCSGPSRRRNAWRRRSAGSA